MAKIYKFKYAKLVRDKIPELIKKDGAKLIKTKILNQKDYLSELKRKLIEEAEELLAADKREEILGELGDMQEILDSILAVLHYKSKDLKKTQSKKNKANGAFKKKIYIDRIEVDNNFSWLEYHLKNKHKYPLIK